MREMLKQRFECFVMKLWIKELQRATKRCRKAREKFDHEWLVLQKLTDEFNKIYGNGARKDDDRT